MTKEDKEFKTMFDYGLTYKQISEVLEVSESVVKSKALRLGLKRYNTDYEPKSKDELIDMFNSGMTYVEMAKVLGVSKTSIYHMKLRFGLVGNTKPINNQEITNKIKSMYLSGCTYKEIGESIGFKERRVMAYVKRLGIKSEKKSAPKPIGSYQSVLSMKW